MYRREGGIDEIGWVTCFDQPWKDSLAPVRLNAIIANTFYNKWSDGGINFIIWLSSKWVRELCCWHVNLIKKLSNLEFIWSLLL